MGHRRVVVAVLQARPGDGPSQGHFVGGLDELVDSFVARVYSPGARLIRLAVSRTPHRSRRGSEIIVRSSRDKYLAERRLAVFVVTGG